LSTIRARTSTPATTTSRRDLFEPLIREPDPMIPGRPRTTDATAFPELNELLTMFVRRVEAILEEDLVGVYLVGSFALGGGDAASDCDFLVVTAGPVGRVHERALRRLHQEIPDWPSYWAYNLEGSYAPQADLRTLSAVARRWLYVNRGGRTMEWSSHCNTEDVRSVLRERPLVVAGADPREFACEVPATTLAREMPRLIEHFLDDLLTWTSFEVSWAQRYAVEASSRMLYTLEHGEVVSKRHALDWAGIALPTEWRDLLDQVRQDRFVRWDDPPRPGSVARALAFVAHVQARARSAPRPAPNPTP